MNCRGGHLVIKIKTQHQCFVIWGWERMGTEKPNPWLNIVSCSSWIFLWFLAMEAFRCGKVFHWIFSAALPNARHTVRFLTQECYFNRHCTKKSLVYVSVDAHVYLPLLCGSLLFSSWFSLPSRSSEGDGAFFPSLRSQHVAGNTWKKGSKPFPAPHCLHLLSKTRCLVSTPKRQHCLKPAEKTKSNTLLQATF